MTFKWTKRYAGFYTLDGTEFGVASANASDVDADSGARKDMSYVEWAVVRKRGGNFDGHNDGDNIAWYGTMREARADAERRAG